MFMVSVVVLGIWDLWAVGMAVGLVLAISIRFLLRYKLKILSEPLVFSKHAARASFRGTPRVFVRGVLGRGRQMSLQEVEAWRVDSSGQRTAVSVVWHPRLVVGPWSLVLSEPAEDGMLFVRVVATERALRHEQTGTWDLSDVKEGQFVPMCDWKSGRLCGNFRDWDKLDSCGSSSSPVR